MNIDDREIFRYLGLHGKTPDDALRELVKSVKSEVCESVSPKSIYKELPFERISDSEISADGVIFESKKLAGHLRTCERLLCFAATLGVESDLLLKKYVLCDSGRAVVCQAVLAAATESYCDAMCEEIAEREEKNGWYLRPRFSPGYADFSLSEQKKLFSLAEISKRTGISLNDECLMTPSKSVTAFIGLTRQKECNFNSCAVCGKTDCEFRRQSV